MFKKDDIIAAMEKTFGCPAKAAAEVPCSLSTIYKWMERSPDVRAVYDKHRETLVDEARLGLRMLVRAHDRWAIGYVLNMDEKYAKEDKLKLEHSGSQDIILKWSEHADIDDSPAEDAPGAGGDIPSPGTV